MASSMRAGAPSRQPDSVDRRDAARSRELDQPELTRSSELDRLLTFLSEAMRETGWTAEALAAHRGDKDASYVCKVLKSEKPLSAKFLVDLPDELEGRFAEKWAAHRGAVVVAPLEGKAAVAALLGGLAGLLAGATLPRRASRMANAVLPKVPR